MEQESVFGPPGRFDDELKNVCAIDPPIRTSRPPTRGIVEVASGIDALYLSGRVVLTKQFLERLEHLRAEAVVLEVALAFDLGGVSMQLQPHAFGKYRFCLDHPFGRIGLTASDQLPAIRVQPRAEFLHGQGPRGTVEWFRELLEVAFGPVLLSVSRVDLFGDFQGWGLKGDHRQEFLSQARERNLHEDGEEFNGLQFGLRGSGTICARLYDKTIESAKTGSAYWKDIWGVAFDPEQPVLRVEFEIARAALRQFGLNTPDEVLDATGALWGYLTSKWLSHRVVSSDGTKSRWPVSKQWEAIRRARVGEDDWGIARMYDGKGRGLLNNLLPSLVGYLASFGALTKSSSFAEIVPTLSDCLAQFAQDTDRTLGDRITEKDRKNALP